MRKLLILLLAPILVMGCASPNAHDGTVRLEWTASGDDGNEGTATSYDLRYSTEMITAANFASATQAVGMPIPAVAGTEESYTVTGLTIGESYFFAIIVYDDKGNASPMSNVAEVDVESPAAVVLRIGP